MDKILKIVDQAGEEYFGFVIGSYNEHRTVAFLHPGRTNQLAGADWRFAFDRVDAVPVDSEEFKSERVAWGYEEVQGGTPVEETPDPTPAADSTSTESPQPAATSPEPSEPITSEFTAQVSDPTENRDPEIA